PGQPHVGGRVGDQPGAKSAFRGGGREAEGGGDHGAGVLQLGATADLLDRELAAARRDRLRSADQGCRLCRANAASWNVTSSSVSSTKVPADGEIARQR